MKRPAIAGVLTLVAVVTAVRADRIHLRGGGIVDADRWWVEGETVRVEVKGGTLGFPRSLVVRIDREKTAEAPAVAAQAATGTPAPPPGPRESISSIEREKASKAVQRGKTHLEAKEYDQASLRFWEALQVDPSLTSARVGYALSEIALGRDAFALPQVLDGLVLAPDSADLNELLGDLRDREERVADAVHSWKRAFEIAPNDRLREKILKGERELAAGRDYAFRPDTHFNLRFDGDLPRDLALEIGGFLEDSFRKLTSRLRHTPGQPITVLLYPEREFRDVTQAPEWVGGVYDGKIRVPLGGITRLDPRAKKVLTHELSHAIVHSKTRGNCPRWLQEGLAMIAEDRPSTRADAQRLRDLLLEGKPPSLSGEAFSYPAAYSFTLFLQSERGDYSLLDLLEELALGRGIDDALHAVYGDGYEALARRWTESLSQVDP